MSASVGHGGNASEKTASAPPVVISVPDDESHVGADDKVKKDARLTKYAKGLNYFRVAKYLFFLLAMVGIIVLALQVSKDQDTIQKLNHEMGTSPRVHDEALEDQLGGRMSYLEGFSGMTADDDNTVVLAARGVMASDDPSAVTSADISTSLSMANATIASGVAETASTETSCSSSGTDVTVEVHRTTTVLSAAASSDTDITVNVHKTTTVLPAASSVSVTVESSTTSDTTSTIPQTQMTTAVFSNTTGTSLLSAAAAGTSIFSVDALSGSMESSMAPVPAISTTTTMTPAIASPMSGLVPANPSHCLEFGDGAGPCNRPYGAPNTPPSSIVLSINTATLSTTFGPPSLKPIPETSPPSSGGVSTSETLDTGAMSGTTTTASSTLSAMDASTVSTTTSTTSSTLSDTATSVCGPPTTVYVTLSASTDTSTSEPGLTVASLSIGSGSDSSSTSPSTVTSTSTSLATTITMSMASVTETVLNSSAPTMSGLMTATGFTLTLTAHGNGTYSPTTTGPTTIATLGPNSGGAKAGGKPMGASGNGGTGNGMYCVVMLVTLLAMLI